MSYIIANGTGYCHRTRTQAVEIVTDIDMATRFKDEDSAQKLLARATKKLGGFSVVDLATAEAAAKKAKRTRTRKKSTNKAAAVQAQAEAGSGSPERTGKAHESQPVPAVSSDKKTADHSVADTSETAEPAAAAEMPEETADQKSSRNRRRRSGRRRKNTNAPESSAETEESTEMTDAAEAPEKAEANAETQKEVPVKSFYLMIYRLTLLLKLLNILISERR